MSDNVYNDEVYCRVEHIIQVDGKKSYNYSQITVPFRVIKCVIKEEKIYKQNALQKRATST